MMPTVRMIVTANIVTMPTSRLMTSAATTALGAGHSELAERLVERAIELDPPPDVMISARTVLAAGQRTIEVEGPAEDRDAGWDTESLRAEYGAPGE